MEEQPEFYTKENGDKFWYLPSEGKSYRHRLDGPAIERADGMKGWFVDNKRHRLDGPAIERSDGTKQWWVDGRRHRLDGPAVEWADGTKEWWVDGERHRIDGPAVEWADGTKHWWYVDGNQLLTEEVETWLKENKIDLTTKEGQMAVKLKWS